jgi:tRNA(Ile)-lysidine synthase
VTAADEPIRPDELDALFSALGCSAGERVALAVSGGGDSTALMVLFAQWLQQRNADPAAHVVLTVDHGLRPESAAEAAAVAIQAAALGFRHSTLVWEGAKPQAGLQAAARAARYALMGDYADANGISTLLTGHTLDDQAETLLMRLARGSGLDGLSGIAPSRQLGFLRLVRPLLATPKSRLIVTLEQRRIRWIEDPSNQSLYFERARLRAAQANLDGLGLTTDMLALSVRRLQRAREALDAATDEFSAEPPKGAVHTDPVGILRIDAERLRRAPEEIALRLVARCIAAAGGSDEPAPLARLEPLVAALRRDAHADGGSWTLSRALLTATPDTIQIEREPGRLPLPQLTLEGGKSALWDGRFIAAVDGSMPGKVELRALGTNGVAELRRLGSTLRSVRALQLTASFWQGSRLLAVPPVGFWATRELESRLSGVFAGLRRNLRQPGCCSDGDSPEHLP